MVVSVSARETVQRSLSACLPTGEHTVADRIVLAELERSGDGGGEAHAAALEHLRALADPTSKTYQPTAFTGYDTKTRDGSKPATGYIVWAESVARHPTDAVFVTHLLVIATILVPSAILLWCRFTPLHACAHWAFTLYCTGPYTLLMHNHLHGNGVLARRFAWIDAIQPYVFGPLLGQTADSYKYHHRYMHHVEGNGPDDLSSTLRYQRDSFTDWLRYYVDFLCNGWWKLARYFYQHGRYALAVRTIVQEGFSVLCVLAAVYVRRAPAIVIFVLPLVQLRFGMMMGNWGQHAFVDEDEPDSDLRSSITVIDVPSNRLSFNDGYHTSHHLNPRRHWRDHPRATLAARDRYASERALVFKDIDFIMISLRLFRKDYGVLADHFVPLGDQRKMSRDEVIAMLQRKTRRFTEAELDAKFRKPVKHG